MSFVIPAYQREFAWETANLKAFLDDLHESKRDSPHFFGPIYHHSNDSNSRALLDGQQRMTAVQITVSVLRDIAQLEFAKLDALLATAKDTDPNFGQLEVDRSRLADWLETFEQALWVKPSLRLRVHAEFESPFALRLLNEGPGNLYAFVCRRAQGISLEDLEYAGYYDAFKTVYQELTAHFYGKSTYFVDLDGGTEKDRLKASQKAENRWWKENFEDVFDSETSADGDEGADGEEKPAEQPQIYAKGGAFRPRNPLDLELFFEFSEKLFAASVISTPIDNGLHWHKIFETLNSRGRPLEQNELIRNHLFAIAKSKFDADPAEIKDEKSFVSGLKESWLAILKPFRAAVPLKLDQVILFYLITHYKGNIALKQKDVVAVASAVISQDYEKFLEDLKAIADRLERVFEKSLPECQDDSVRERLVEAFYGLATLNDEYAFLPVVATACVDPSLPLASALEGAEAFTFRARKVLKLKQKPFQDFLRVESRKLFEGVRSSSSGARVPQATVNQFRSNCRSKVGDKAFADAFTKGEYRPSQSAEQHYALLKFYRQKDKSRARWKNPAEEVEHVFPKTPRNRYPSISKHLKSIKDPKEQSSYLNQLGNLCLLEAKVNRSLQNKEFHKKVDADKRMRSGKGHVAGEKKWEDYRGSKSIQVADVIKAAAKSGTPLEWRHEHIVKRNKAFGREAAAVWNLDAE